MSGIFYQASPPRVDLLTGRLVDGGRPMGTGFFITQLPVANDMMTIVVIIIIVETASLRSINCLRDAQFLSITKLWNYWFCFIILLLLLNLPVYFTIMFYNIHIYINCYLLSLAFLDNSQGGVGGGKCLLIHILYISSTEYQEQ